MTHSSPVLQSAAALHFAMPAQKSYFHPRRKNKSPLFAMGPLNSILTYLSTF